MARIKILIVDDEKLLREISSTLLESQYNCEIVESFSGNHAKKILSEEGHTFDIIICDYSMPDGRGDVVYRYTQEMENPPAFIMASAWGYEESKGMETLLSDSDRNGYIAKPYSANDLYQIIDKVYSESGREEDLSYRRVSISNFLESGFQSVSMFLKLSSNKYVKILGASESDKAIVLDKYLKRDVYYIYLKDSEYDQYLEILFEKVRKKLDGGDIDPKELFAIQANSVASIHEIVFNLGIDKKAVVLADQFIASTLDAVKSQKNIHLFLESVVVETGRYNFLHAHLTSYVISALCHECHWVREGHLQSFIFASLFQNICFKDEKLAMISSKHSNEWDAMSERDQKIVNEHMVKAVTLLDQLESFTVEAKNAILNHHERPDGEGFPRGLTADQVGQLDTLFIISCHFSHELIVQGNSKKSIENIVTSFRDYYNIGQYQESIKAFLRVFG